MTRNRKVWLVCGAAMGLPLTGHAQLVRQVQVSESKGRVEIHVIGADLPKPDHVTWRKDLAYTLEWSAGLQSPGGRIRVDSGAVKSVWYGWYTAHPHSMRVQVQLSKDETPVVKQEPTGWLITFGGPKPVPAEVTNPAPGAASKVHLKEPSAITATPAPEEIKVAAPMNRVGLSIDTPQLAALKGTASKVSLDKSAPVVIKTPPIDRWSTLEKMDKLQIQKPAPFPSLFDKPAQRPTTGAIPVDVPMQGGYRLVTLDCSNADLTQVLKGLALQSGANIVIGPNVSGRVTADLHDVTIDRALKYISYLTGVKYEMNDGVYMFGIVETAAGAAPIHPTAPVTKTLFIRSEQEGRIVLILASQFTGSGLVIISSDKTEDKSDHKSDTDSNANYNALLSVESAVLGRHFIIFLGPQDLVEKAMTISKEIDNELVQGYDVELNNQQLYTYDVRYADPRALREALISQVQGLRAVIAPNAVGNFDTYKEGKTRTQSNEQSKVEDQVNGASGGQGNQAATQQAVGSVNTSSVDDGSLESPFSKEESVAVPMRLVLRGTAAQVQEALRYAKVLDVPPKQVALELRVMELTKTDALNAGIDWSIVTGGAVKLLNLNNAQTSPSNTASISISGKGFNGDVTASLDALAEKNKLVARPNLVAMDGRQSEVFIGDIIRYVESITQSQNGTTVTTGEVPVGVRLSVLPRIGADGNMTLDLRPRVSLLTSFTQVPGGGELPQTSSRFAQSTISLKSGETLAIGGLIQDQDVKTLSGIPILMNLPILGPLFRSTTTSKERTELVIFLTARTINGPVGSDQLPMLSDVQEKKAVVTGQ